MHLKRYDERMKAERREKLQQLAASMEMPLNQIKLKLLERKYGRLPLN